MYWMDQCLHRDGLHQVQRVCFPDECWRPEDLDRFADRPGQVIKAIVTEDGTVIGSLLYRLTDSKLVLRRVAVLPPYRRRGVAHAALTTLTGRSNPLRRGLYLARVREHNVPVQRLLAGLGFRCEHTEPRAFPYAGADREDGYWFLLHRPELVRRRRVLPAANVILH